MKPLFRDGILDKLNPHDVEISKFHVYNLYLRTQFGATYCGKYENNTFSSIGHITLYQIGFNGNSRQGANITST